MRYGHWYLALFLAFLLGNYEGFVALWRNPGGEPDCIFPYSLSSLPESDQRKLEEGIIIESEDALRQILEDYLS